MKVRFTATERLREYRGWDGKQRIILRDGEEAEVGQEKAAILVRDLPSNFREISAPPADRMIRSAKHKKQAG